MVIDKIDLAIIRHIERSGYWLSPLTDQLSITIDEIKQRLKKLEDNKIVSDYKATIFIPPFLGGEWTWGCILATAQHREKVINQILKKITFVNEIWLNSNLPSNLGHNFSLIFYSKDFDTEVKFIQELSEISYLEAYRISDYTFPLPRIFSSEEIILLKNIFTNPTANYEELGEKCHKHSDWIKSKHEKLTWTPQNKDGVIYVLPEINYSQIENYAHCHFIVESKTNLQLLVDELKISGFELVANQHPHQNQYTQIEADLWGFNDFLLKKSHLDSFSEIKIKGIIFAEKMSVVSDWGVKLLNR
jgi:DNA-binding Lrp family transcriptional regulator